MNKWNLGISALLAWTLLGPIIARAETDKIRATDADGVERTLNQTGRVNVIIYSNPSVQDRTRAAGKSLDPFQGKESFRSVVVVDLRGTMADWAPGYTVRRMVRDLNTEAERIRPAYEKNGNQGDPRKDVSAVADFKGETCDALDWDKPANQLRVIVFGKSGAKVKEWSDLKDYAQMTKTVKAELAKD